MPSPNATVVEYEAATTITEGRNTYHVFYVEKHRSGTTGRAKIMVAGTTRKHINMFLKHLWSLLEGSGSNLLFPNREGISLDHLSRHVTKLATQLDISLPETATKTRHAAATAVADRSDAER